ncbi:MAG: aspartate-semialdehyde dehydrogenase, partial [Candidatus Coatesbacteria bacterium]|nr:aspartate-semialdehyde dehydrogenase [Candidatus Coatesbacteria bacterium]
VEFAIFAATSEASAEFAPIAAKAGAIAIDNSAHFRLTPGVPLIVPEINAKSINGHSGIIANPNCSTIQLLMVLYPLERKFGVRRAVVSTYQSVSGSGKMALDELAHQSLAMLTLRELKVEVYPHRIGFNLIPCIGEFDADGYSVEETKLKRETAKILDRSDDIISPTCIRVPVFNCHSQSLSIELKSRASCGEVREVLSEFPGVAVSDAFLDSRLGVPSTGADYPMPSDCSEQDDVVVGRIRLDKTVEYGINLWSVTDNLRKGAALNAIQIAELLI